MIDLEEPADHDPSQAGAGFRGCAADAAPVAALIQRKPGRIDSIHARKMHKTSAFDQLLRGAAAQPEPQRLLFAFATAELPQDATPAQPERYAAGGGGTLAPVICVDKGLDELTGRNGQSPGAEQVDLALQTMVERVRGGMHESFLALDKPSDALQFV